MMPREKQKSKWGWDTKYKWEGRLISFCFSMQRAHVYRKIGFGIFNEV